MSITEKVIIVEQLLDFTNQLIKSSVYKLRKQKSLLASHKAHNRHLIFINLLRLYENVGLNCTTIHGIFSFKQEATRKDLISTNISLRKAARTKF